MLQRKRLACIDNTIQPQLMDIANYIATKIYRIRIKRGMHLTSFKGISKRTMIRYESAERTPDILTLYKICDQLNCEIWDILPKNGKN